MVNWQLRVETVSQVARSCLNHDLPSSVLVPTATPHTQRHGILGLNESKMQFFMTHLFSKYLKIICNVKIGCLSRYWRQDRDSRGQSLYPQGEQWCRGKIRVTALSWLLGWLLCHDFWVTAKEMKELWGLRKTVSLCLFYEEQVKVSLRTWRLERAEQMEGVGEGG